MKRALLILLLAVIIPTLITGKQKKAPTPCRDVTTHCVDWARNGECGSNPLYMLVNCRLSCGRCNTESTTTVPATSTTAGCPKKCDSKIEGACNWCAGGVQPYRNSRHADFYKKLCLTHRGLRVVSSSIVSDAALHRTAFLLDRVTENVGQDVINSMNGRGFHHAVMAAYPIELTLDIPEHSDAPSEYNERARGLGAMVDNPTGSGAEENVMCHGDDRYRGEDITIHEFAHSLHLLGLQFVIGSFQTQLDHLFSSMLARSRPGSLWHDHYAETNAEEYFAEALQSFFDANYEKNKTRLQSEDLAMFRFIEKHIGESEWRWSCIYDP